MAGRGSALLWGLMAGAAVFAADVPPVPFPHPVITEVFYAVPAGADANRDGDADSAGDEFVEVMNPHDRAIDLAGYAIVDRQGLEELPKAGARAGGKGGGRKVGVVFVFPALRLEPGEIAVVFNGYKARMEGPVGTSARAEGKHPEFHGAYVFSMKTTAKTRSFANAGDFAALVSPRDEVVDCVYWGESKTDGDIAPPEGALRSAQAPRVSKCSVQRVTANGPMLAHLEIDGRACSPGEMPAASGSQGERAGEKSGGKPGRRPAKPAGESKPGAAAPKP